MMATVLWFNSWANFGFVQTEDGKSHMIRSKRGLNRDQVVRVRRVGDVVVPTEEIVVDTYLERFSLSLRYKSTR
jgi:cold shock CspA family protein